ncbi:hypothetical protein C8F04DRAFT_1176351 [Mycena alexandri]|uniref:Restriction of telomere capping protein 4 C-terminal domain-containing protein n=1 Tax=Mycena alexandri TaxID=1745969 RepID=A0AAD6XED0_9AGAR|nr:hypothetical protein C8F04DRAFT_1176351 [Mycena alexandri]
MCDEHLPAKENDRLLSLFQRLQDLKFSVGSTGVGVSFLQLEICAAITEENKKNNYLQIGALSRILELQEPLLEMLQDAETLRASPNIGYKIFCFSKSESKQRFPDAVKGCRCGYVKDFVSFIVTPHIASLLISEDHDISIEDATQVLEESSEFGDLIQRHDEEDSVIDQLHHKNIRQMNRGKNYFLLHSPNQIPSQSPPQSRKEGRLIQGRGKGQGHHCVWRIWASFKV